MSRVLGYETMGEEVIGYDDWGYATVGAMPALRPAPGYGRAPGPVPASGGPMRPVTLAVPQQPPWRPMLAPGVPEPGYGLEPLPLRALQNGGVLTPAVPTIDFEARPQRPFRSERLIAIVSRSAGAGAVRALTSGIFIGTQLQQLELADLDLDIFRPDAFGVRLALIQAEPGVLIRIQVRGSIAVPANESVSVSLTFMGHSAR